MLTFDLMSIHRYILWCIWQYIFTLNLENNNSWDSENITFTVELEMRVLILVHHPKENKKQ